MDPQSDNGYINNIAQTPTPKSSQNGGSSINLNQFNSLLHEAPKSKRILEPIQNNLFYSAPRRGSKFETINDKQAFSPPKMQSNEAQRFENEFFRNKSAHRPSGKQKTTAFADTKAQRYLNQ